ncbi:hypothetical protein NCAS_0E02310 [Naumovozyma castellii]|uniref:Zn(2)-C6 fungal-type domain-containing protein n=1 Tax=Naumovozyma castellii TaxID=27288 RepID=G0VFN4_NAUCA|nr:hypothetical protein NCAS_0E02310 [Naumovozyma castellii CBS 4309]CCC70301.1 hypothetical protein NCAS_0E02310 [Naumovozyma castellii CBS 4309]
MNYSNGPTKSKRELLEGEDGNELDILDDYPKRKRLACSNCRRRRKKCDLNFPCANCIRLGLNCNVNEEDMRKKRYTSSYVKSLEGHIAYLESNLKNLVDKMYPNDKKMLNNMMIGDVIAGFIDTAKNDELATNPSVSKKESTQESIANNASNTQNNNANNTLPKVPILNPTTVPSIPRSDKSPPHDGSQVEKRKRTFVKGSLYPDGPVIYKHKPLATVNSSAVSVSPLVSSNNSSSSNLESTFTNGKESHLKERISDLNTTVIKRAATIGDLNSLNNDSKILESLSNFYKFLYPGHFIFVHRESFLYGFFNHSENNYKDSHYCSEELIYAMCAVGSRLTPELQDMSEIYYEKSKSTLLELVFDENSVAKITTVQALLCLAFYELGKGNNQLAWYFSGLAIRVGYDMGFQLDPKVWYTDDTDVQLTASELKIRSRIYWGCYIADHFICLMLGRTSTLSVSNSTIPESDELPEVDGTEEFRFVGKHVLQISLPLKNLIILSRIVQIFTSKIFIETEETEAKVEYLNNFNLQVQSWRQSLPGFLNWSKEILKDEDVSTDPTISYFYYYYYIVVLTFNKPFMEDCPESQIIIFEILDDLKILFDNFKHKFGSFNKATLYQLYVCLLAINCIKKLRQQTNLTSANDSKWDEQLEYFNDIFYKGLSPAYQLPKRLQEDTDYEMEQEKQGLIQMSSNTNYTHDFSLSNEIDDLIKDLFGVPYAPT